MKNWIFSHCFALKAFPCRGSFLDLNLYFALVYLFHYYFSKKCLREIIYFLLNVWWACNFFCIPMLPLTFLFIYRHEYTFSSDKNWLFSERFSVFLEGRAHSKNEQLLMPDFSLNNFLMKPFLIGIYFWNPQEALNKRIGRHITEVRTKTHKKWPTLIFA